jgi:hypothetical protein
VSSTTTPVPPVAATAPATSAPATSAPATSAPATTSDFRGIFEFAGQDSAADAGDPDLAGVDLVYYWSQIEPSPGVYDWTVIDQAMAPWVAAGKQVVLRISTAGATSWDPPYSGRATPAWVLADGTRTVTDRGSVFPVYWDSAYLDDYRTFVQALGAHYDGDPSVAFIQPGIGMGGETLPETDASPAGIAAWQAAGYTDGLWLSTAEELASFYRDAFTRTPVYPLVDRTFFDGNGADIDTFMAWLRAVPGWGLQNDGLSATQQLSPNWSGPPLALEQLDPTATSGDCLCADLAQGIDALHGRYVLIYRSDIDDPADQGYLAQAAARARPAG